MLYISGSGIWSRRSPGYGGKLGIKVTKYEPQGLSLTCHYSSVICIIPGDVAVRRSEQFQQESEEQDARYHAFQPLLLLQI